MFYDIGSGTGKAVRDAAGRVVRPRPHPLPGQVFAAALVHPFERCVGIEVRWPARAGRQSVGVGR